MIRVFISILATLCFLGYSKPDMYDYPKSVPEDFSISLTWGCYGVSSYESKTGKPVSTFGGYAHDALLLIVNAIETDGSSDPTAIRDAIESTAGLVGTTGIYTMSAEDHLGLDLSAFRMLEIRDGKWTIIE